MAPVTETEREMLTVHDYERIRQAYYVEKKSIRQIGREYGHGYWMVRKALDQSEPQPYQLSQSKDAPMLGAYMGQIEAMLTENERLPRKQRNVAIVLVFHAEATATSASVKMRFDCSASTKNAYARRVLEFFAIKADSCSRLQGLDPFEA